MKPLGAAALAAALLVPPAAAANAASTYVSLQLAPQSVTIDAAHPAGDVVMSSLDAHPAIFDVEAQAWHQNASGEQFTAAKDLLVVPPVYDVQPYEQQLVRVGFSGAFPIDRERAYRLRFREVPQPGSPEKPRDFTVRVFVRPAVRRGNVEYRIASGDARGASLVVQNDSNEHVYVGALRVAQGAQQCYSGSPDAYVLAQTTRSIPLTLVCTLRSGNAQVTMSDGTSETPIDVPVR